jgi:hypothetical protein
MGLEFAAARAMSSLMSNIVRIIALILAIGFTALAGWASFRGDFGAEFGAITAMPWGRVSLVDLYLGFLIYGFFVWLVEDRLSIRLLWLVPVFFIGNAWSLMWIAVRWDKIMAFFKQR